MPTSTTEHARSDPRGAADRTMISVVFPFRDAAVTVGAALDSVLVEGCVGEVIAVDDGSVDGGRAAVEARAARDPRLRLVDAGGVGVARALAIGVARARGDYLARMDADDLSRPGRIAASVAALEASPRLSAVGTRVRAFPAPAEGMIAYLAWQNAIVTPDDVRRAIFVEAPLCHPSVTLRRAALEAVGGYREAPWPEDYDLWLRLVVAGHDLAKVPEVLLDWRRGAGKVTVADPRCSQRSLAAARAAYLPAVLPAGRSLFVWGAGRAGRVLARELEGRGVRVSAFVDIDPRKIGRRARGAPIVSPEALASTAPRPFVVVAVATRGARDVVSQRLAGLGFAAPGDFLCAS